jgi:eukaryotic-like serine/threonine-protein kinase
VSRASRPSWFGPYLLLERAGEGRTGDVFKAKRAGQPGLRDLLAIKRLHLDLAQSQVFVAAWLDAAHQAQRLVHPNIVAVREVDHVAHTPYLAMDYVYGQSLAAVLQRTRERGARVPPAMACHVVMKLCEGLDYAHNARDEDGRPLGMVHREVSPTKVLVSTTGEVKVLGFGLARAAAKASKARADLLRGRRCHTSPEQVRGAPVDRRSDVFMAGILLHELLTGEPLFVGATDFSVLEKISRVQAPAPSHLVPGLPRALDTIALTALAPEPDARYPAAMDLHDALQGHLYSSGSIFGSGDLAGWLHEVFSREIEAEGVREEQQRLLEEEMANDRDKLGDPDTERHPRVPEAAARPQGPPRSKTMVGLGAPPPIPPGASKPPPPPSAAAAPSKRGTDPGEWDDDDMATQVYDKAEHGERLPSVPPPAPTPASASPSMPRPDAAPAPSAPTPRASSPGFPRPTPTPMMRSSVPPPKPRRAGPGPATTPDSLPPTVEVRDEPPLRGDPTIQDLPGTGAAALAQQAQRAPSQRRRSRERTEVLERPAGPNRNTLVAVGAMGLLMLLGLGIGAYAVMGPKTPGTIQLVTSPPDAVVLLDEEPVAATASPFVIRNVTPNTVHLLEVRKDGFRPWTMQVDLQAGETLEIPPVTLLPLTGTAGAPVAAPGVPAQPGAAPAASAAEVAHEATPGAAPAPEAADSGRLVMHFHSEPEGARVEIERGDERRVVGFTPTWARMTREGGPWTVRISNVGYEVWEKQVELPADREDHRVRAVLTRKDGTVRPASRPAATRFAPRPAPAPSPRPAPAPKEPVTASAPAPAPAPSVSAPAAPEATGNGTLRISTRPWTNVSIGGRSIGSTPQMNISLPPGRHTVRLTNPEFGIDENVVVTIEPGQTVTKILTLNQPE